MSQSRSSDQTSSASGRFSPRRTGSRRDLRSGGVILGQSRFCICSLLRMHQRWSRDHGPATKDLATRSRGSSRRFCQVRRKSGGSPKQTHACQLAGGASTCRSGGFRTFAAGNAFLSPFVEADVRFWDRQADPTLDDAILDRRVRNAHRHKVALVLDQNERGLHMNQIHRDHRRLDQSEHNRGQRPQSSLGYRPPASEVV